MKKLVLILTLCLLLTACTAAKAPEAPAVTEALVAPVTMDTATEAPEPTATTEPTATPEPPYEGPTFALTTLTGESIDESYFKDHRLTMVNFWATWCGPCVDEMPDLARIHADYADKGFGILGVMLDEDTAAALALINESAIGYPIVLNDIAFDEFIKDIYAVPTTLFLDASGHAVGEAQVGSMSYEGWTRLIDTLLADLA